MQPQNRQPKSPQALLESVQKRKEKGVDPSVALADMVREFGGITDFVGAEYDVLDSVTKEVLFVVRKRPLTIEQFNSFAYALRSLRELEAKKMKEMNKNPRRGMR